MKIRSVQLGLHDLKIAKVLFVLSVLSMTLVQKVVACGFCAPTYNYYLFHSAPGGAMNNDSELLAREWSRMIKGTVTVEDMERMAELTLADVDTLKHPVLNYARNHRDTEMLAYLRDLATYLSIPQLSLDEWYYPSEDELKERKVVAVKLEKRLDAVKSSRFAAQYKLLRIRLAFRMEEYDKCLNLWENEGDNNDTSVFGKMTKGYYAGALKRLGRREEAAVIFAELRDEQSAILCMNSRSQNVRFMRAIAEKDLNSAVLPYMLDVLMNNIQEMNDFLKCKRRIEGIVKSGTKDLSGVFDNIPATAMAPVEMDDEGNVVSVGELTEENWYSMLDAFAMHESEIAALKEFCSEMAVKEGVKDKCMWLSALAYLHYFDGKYAEANDEINRACSMTSFPASNDNARVLRLLICTTLDDNKAMEKILCADFPWLMQNKGINAIHKIAVHGLAARYEAKKDFCMNLLSWSLTRMNDYEGEYQDLFKKHSPEDNGKFFSLFQSATLEQEKALYDFVFNKKNKQTQWQKTLIQAAGLNNEDIEDMIGTRLLRMGKWAEAAEWLRKVSLEFLSEQNIAYYAHERNYDVELWATHQDVKRSFGDPVQLRKNKKLTFCEEVINLNKELKKAKGEAKAKLAYKLATLYSQASYYGECWWLTEYHKSDYCNIGYGAITKDSFDFDGQAVSLLNEASKVDDDIMKMKCAFAQIAVSKNPPYSWMLDDDTYTFKLQVNKNSPLFSTLKQLRKMLKESKVAPTYISQCDMLRTAFKLSGM